jgi:hypothetical protein
LSALAFEVTVANLLDIRTRRLVVTDNRAYPVLAESRSLLTTDPNRVNTTLAEARFVVVAQETRQDILI